MERGKLLEWSGCAAPSEERHSTVVLAQEARNTFSMFYLPPRAELSKDSNYPEDKKHGEWNSQQPENESFSHDGPLSHHTANDVESVLVYAGPIPSEGWPGLRHVLPLVQGSTPLVYESWDRLCPHR